ncbi:MAG: glucodextranase DOMON-like domain-containing protein [Candidatus Eisenbacteria bacterium]
MRWMTCVIVCAAVLLPLQEAGAELLAAWTDPANDDTGDGDYVYPTNEAFGEMGQADILAFTIEKENGDLVFTFTLRNLVDPWNVGNRLTMVAVAIDTQEGGDGELRRNANVMLESPSEYQVFAGGETVQIVDAESEPVDVGATVVTDVDRNTIRISVPIASIDGAASDWRFAAAAGLQDDYGAGGLGDFREVKAEPGEWRGGGGDDLAIDPNVYDIVVPAPRKILGLFGGGSKGQAEILSGYSLEKGRLATLPSLEID